MRQIFENLRQSCILKKQTMTSKANLIWEKKLINGKTMFIIGYGRVLIVICNMLSSWFDFECKKYQPIRKPFNE